MKYIYAALLLHSAGKELTEENLTKVMKSIGETPDKAQIKSLTTALSEINVEEVLRSATAVPTVTAPPEKAPTPAPEPSKEEKKPKKKEEEEAEEEAFEGLGSLFG
ncbi:MAG: 50S ribosomal protein P1 [Candidatus Geothermarchaeales archaeon]